MDLRTALLALLLLPATASPPLHAGDLAPPPLMLATTLDVADTATLAIQEFLVSEKLDGVRAHWDGRRLRTRSGMPIQAPAWFTDGWPAQALDGELWIGRGRFQDVSDLVRAFSAADAAWREVRFMAFDLPGEEAPFGRRAARLRALLDDAAVPWLGAIAQLRLRTPAHLQAHLREVVAGGGEGLVLHRADARYRAGRSDGLRKLKPWRDAEARVVGYRAGKGKYAGQVGALVVEDASGRRFALGSGLDDADRLHPPAKGTLVTYRYNGLTGKGTPRFARFLRVRTE